jgi:deoxyribonuclease V
MILAFDTYYFENRARTACISFKNWDDEVFDEYIEVLEGINEYRSGEFYKRELPCILSLFEKIKKENLEAIIVDGYVYLDDMHKLGLGGHLYNSLNSKVPVIGVAKSRFATIVKNKNALYRGQSSKPLYITSIGIDLEKSTGFIKNMKGEYRIPTLLKKLDALTRKEN